MTQTIRGVTITEQTPFRRETVQMRHEARVVRNVPAACSGSASASSACWNISCIRCTTVITGIIQRNFSQSRTDRPSVESFEAHNRKRLRSRRWPSLAAARMNSALSAVEDH